ncbi:MAG: arylesterase [Desulfuromonadales bacterium]
MLRLILFVLTLVAVHGTSVSANDTAEKPIRLLVLGDSLAAGYGLPEADAFPSQLEAALQKAGQTVRVINAGVSGDTTAGGRARLDWALGDKPQLVIVELGANDALRGLPPHQTRENLDAILTRLKEAGVRVILAGMQAPRNMGADYTAAFDPIYSELARKHHVALYPFFLEGVALEPALNQADGIHPNPAGVAEIVKRILPMVLQELEKIMENQ